MKIKMKSNAAGPLGNFHAGKVYDVEDSIGERFVAGGYAEEVAAPAEEAGHAAPESASIAPPENAMQPAAAPRRPGARASKRSN